jgi:tRNA (guanine-N7-)-methyltransferase
MKKRWRQHVNPLKMTSLVPREAPLSLPGHGPVEVELGCGDARFLMELARADPRTLFVGLDIREEFLAAARTELAELGLDNVLLETANLLVDAGRLLPPGRVRRLYVNFPDPWFKRRQRNRRWLTAETLEQLLPALAPGCEVLYQTDVWSLAIEALALFEASDRLRNTAGPWTFLRRPASPVRTSREQACLEEGKQIWRLLFVHQPHPPE